MSDLVRPIKQVHQNKINDAIKTLEDNQEKLSNAEETLNLYYDDVLEDIERRQRNEPEIKNLQVISFQVEETRQLLTALEELTGAALDESLRIKVFLDGSSTLRGRLVTRRQPLRQALQRESIG